MKKNKGPTFCDQQSCYLNINKTQNLTKCNPAFNCCWIKLNYIWGILHKHKMIVSAEMSKLSRFWSLLDSFSPNSKLCMEQWPSCHFMSQGKLIRMGKRGHTKYSKKYFIFCLLFGCDHVQPFFYWFEYVNLWLTRLKLALRGLRMGNLQYTSNQQM